MKIFYEFECLLDDFGFFVDFYAKKSGVNYSLYKKDDVFVLALDDSDEKILDFNDNYLIDIPYFLFLKGYLIKQDFDLSSYKLYTPKQTKFIKKPTPLYQKTKINEHNITCNDVSLLKDKLLNKESIYIDGYELSMQPSECVVVADFKLLDKAFIAQKHHQIHINSYENPFIKLRLKDVFKSFHNLDDEYFVGFAPSIDIYNLLKDFDSLVYIKSDDIFKIISLDDDFVMLTNPYDIKTKHYKNTISQDFKTTYIPKDLHEFRALFNGEDTSSRLLANYEKEFSFKDDYPRLGDDLKSLFELISYVLECDVMGEFSKSYISKAPRIDFKLENNKLNVKSSISSVMSFRLAGVMPKMICCGVVESFVYFLDRYKDEVKELSISGQIFENEKFLKLLKTISMDTIKADFITQTNEI